MTHSFDVEIAKELGIEKAVILHNLVFWINKNIANYKNKYDGKTYSYNSYEAFEELFPYMKKEKIKRVILSLEKDDILVSRTDLNKNKFDKTKWYSYGNNPIVKKLGLIDEKALNNDVHSIVQDNLSDGAKLHDGECKIASSIKNNNQRQIKNQIENSDNKNIQKDFSFSLTKSSQFENTSAEYQDKLKAYAVSKDGAYSYQAFLDHHLAKGSKFKDWSRAYNTWINNSIKFNKFVPTAYIKKLDHPTLEAVYAEYGTNRAYDTSTLCYLGTFKQMAKTEQPQQQPEHQTANKSVEGIFAGLAESKRVS